MTLIIRAPGRIESPMPGAFDPPKLGVTGIFSRFVSVGAAPNIGDVITTLKDQVGSHDLIASAGTVTFDKVGSLPVVSLAAAGRNTMASVAFAGLPKGRTIAMLAYFSANPGATEQLIKTIPTNIAALAATGGSFAAYGDGASFPASAAVAKPGWFVVVASLGADGTAKIAVNGVIKDGALTFANSGTTSRFDITAPGTIGMKLVDLAIIDHAVTDDEIASITAGLTKWLPK